MSIEPKPASLYDTDPRVLSTVNGWAVTFNDVVYYIRPLTVEPDGSHGPKRRPPHYPDAVPGFEVVSADGDQVIVYAGDATPNRAIEFFLGEPQSMAAAS